MTSWGGIPLLVRAFRSLGLAQTVKQHVQIKQRRRGYEEARSVESFVILNAVGGECSELRFKRAWNEFEDVSVATGIGHSRGKRPGVKVEDFNDDGWADNSGGRRPRRAATVSEPRWKEPLRVGASSRARLRRG